MRPAVGPFEENRTHLLFEIAQAAAERRLSNLKRYSSLPETAVLGGDDRPPHIS
jgi:hypothetical protein